MGKTAFVLNIADYIAVRRQKTCLIFSLEMSKEQLVNRMLAMESNVDSPEAADGNADRRRLGRSGRGHRHHREFKADHRRYPGYLCYGAGIQMPEGEAEYGLDLVMIDTSS